jgi:formylglycine-generating enzyme required for sulfatase activity
MRIEQRMKRNSMRMDRFAMKRLMTVVCAFACGVAAAAPHVLPTWTESVTGMVFVALPKGCFQMGTAKPVDPPFDSHWARIGYKGNLAEDEVPQHEVCVDALWLAKTEVSEADWNKVMGGEAPADGGRRAKVGVTWLQARQFAEHLTAQSAGKLRFRLPTEAEWEYACRAGAGEAPLPEREHLADKAWYAQSPERSYEAREVGVLQANAFGLHDMLGNAWEWTQDSYRADAYARHALYNSKVESAGAPRVIRGGSFRTELMQTRCTMRGRYEPAATLNSIGMRLVREH